MIPFLSYLSAFVPQRLVDRYLLTERSSSAHRGNFGGGRRDGAVVGTISERGPRLAGRVTKHHATGVGSDCWFLQWGGAMWGDRGS